MQKSSIIFRRELAAYFRSPLAYVFIVIFLVVAGALTFYVGSFVERGRADLEAFFMFHPWLYLVLMPALGMRLWSEERKTGTIEFLMTQSVSPVQAVLGKFFAAWAFAGIALVLTFPFWVTVNVLGEPDNGIIAGAYFASWLMAGGFLGISACLSALTSNQVIAFVLGIAACFVFLMSGVDLVQAFFRGWAPDFLVDAVAALSFQTNYHSVVQGVIDLRSLIFFLSTIATALFINAVIVEAKKGA